MALPTVPRHSRAYKAAPAGFETVAEITDRVLTHHRIKQAFHESRQSLLPARWLLPVVLLALLAAMLPLFIPTAPTTTNTTTSWRHHG